MRINIKHFILIITLTSILIGGTRVAYTRPGLMMKIPISSNKKAPYIFRTGFGTEVHNINPFNTAKGVYFENKEENYFIEALKLKEEVIDTTGAGDAFNGALAVALAKNYNYEDAIIFANKVGGISTTRLGASSSMPLLSEVEGY